MRYVRDFLQTCFKRVRARSVLQTRRQDHRRRLPPVFQRCVHPGPRLHAQLLQCPVPVLCRNRTPCQNLTPLA